MSILSCQSSHKSFKVSTSNNMLRGLMTEDGAAFLQGRRARGRWNTESQRRLSAARAACGARAAPGWPWRAAAALLRLAAGAAQLSADVRVAHSAAVARPIDASRAHAPRAPPARLRSARPTSARSARLALLALGASCQPRRVPT